VTVAEDVGALERELWAALE